MNAETTPAADETPSFAPPTNLWKVISVGLVSASTAVLLGGVLYVVGLHDLSGRDRIELVSTLGASVATAMLVLGAALALVAAARAAAAPERFRPLFALAFGVAIMTALLNLYSIIDLATMKVEQTPFTVAISVLTNASWQSRLAAILPHVATVIVAVLAVVIAQRLAPSGTREDVATTT